MKKIKTMLAMILALVAMTVAFSACSSDNDDDNTGSTATQLAGTYTGDVEMFVSGTSYGSESNKTLVFTASSNVTANITLPAAGSDKMQLPALEVANVLVTTKAGVPSFSVSNYKGTTSEGKAYTVNLEGSYSNSKLTVDYSVQYGNMPMAITFKYVSSSKK